MENFVGTARKIGNSLIVTIPGSIRDVELINEGDAVEVNIRKVSDSEIKKKQLLKKYNWFGEGEIAYPTEDAIIGKVREIYLNTGEGYSWSDIHPQKIKETYYDGIVFGEFTNKEFVECYIKGFGNSLSLELCLKLKIKNKNGEEKDEKIWILFNCDRKTKTIAKEIIGRTRSSEETYKELNNIK